MKAALVIVAIVAAYLAGQLYSFWRSRKDDIPPAPPGGWKKSDDWDEEDDGPNRKDR
jgi:hypothetical protein